MTGTMELTQMQLYQVAEKVSPNDWVTLGVHLGFKFPEIEQWKEEHKGNIKRGIFKMLVTWLGIHPTFTKPDARNFLAYQFKAMKKMDLAYSLINTEVCFVPPHHIKVSDSSRQFEYEVRSCQKERELSFNVSMESREGLVHPSLILANLSMPCEFADKLCACIHALGLRLIRMQLQSGPGSSIKVTVAAIDEDGVKELRTRLMSQQIHFIEDLKRIICKYVSFDIEKSTIYLQTSFSEEEFGRVIQFFRDEASSASSNAAPLRVNNFEIVRLAKELDANMLTLLGLKLGVTEPEMSDLRIQGKNSRSVFEHMLFDWKSKHSPCMDDLSDLAEILESVGAALLAQQLRRGELRETEREEQRRTYLQRASASCDLKALMKNHPFSRAKLPGPADATATQVSPLPRYVNYPQPAPSEDSQESMSGQRTYAHTVSLQDKARPLPEQDAGDPDYARVIHRTGQANPLGCIQEDVPAIEEPLYERIPSDLEASPPPVDLEGDHTYVNDDVHLRPHPIKKDPVKRASHKRQGTSTIPVLHSLDFSVLEGTWDSLAHYGVTDRDTGHTAGLIKLAQALNEIGQTDIADTIWIALIKDHFKNEYLHRFVTGNITVIPRVITNRQHIDIGQETTLDEVVNRTKDKEFPSRIFIEAGRYEDRQMVAEKLGYDWAMQKDPQSPLGNVDVLYVLKVADIDPGTTVGGAIASQRVCRDFKLNPSRIEDYFKNTMTEYVIVLKGDDDDFQRLLSVSSSDDRKPGFRELVTGRYLSHCIVIMTVGPQALVERPTIFAHYKLQSATSDC
ncbi:uncharacterized protein LOC100890170 [Strongylocentrotus purpuratus]|uniref:Death domain-containing protein n=1 Tax=Strongylocentrotus purpuratus TaxID=7668 RepID=A0A7M7PBI0_STRPU|nr:uncharacterized protein LOC100890170 [Strongylocentrotus purpuratus]